MSAQPPERLRELDALRGIAALMVMLYHYTVQYQELAGRPAAAFSLPAGRYGVYLFFVISGFVIFLTLNRTKSFWDFVVSRFARLYPAYWTCIGVTFAVLLLLPMPGLNVSAGDAAWNLTMLQYWLQKPTVDGVYWTLSVELMFYSFVSVLYLTGRLRHVESWTAVWLGVIFAAHWLMRSGFTIPSMVRTTLLLEYGHFFFTGVLFYRLKVCGFSWVRCLLVATCVAAAAWVRDAAHMAALLACAVVFVAFIKGWLGWLAVSPFLFLGEISYPLYLLHQHIGYAVIARLEKAGLTGEGWLLVPAALILLLATGVNVWVEKPARLWLRQKWGARRPGSPAAPAATPVESDKQLHKTCDMPIQAHASRKLDIETGGRENLNC